VRKTKAPEVRCERCQTALVEISITIAERPVTMRSCSRCDRRSWSSEGKSVPLGGVLDQIGATRR
jgi:hypothetical protein